MDARDTRYEEAKALARHPDAGVRARIAARADLPPEILYFLAEDGDPTVRSAVAANPATPQQADLFLARDANLGVRCALAHKMVGDGLAGEERRKLWRMGFTILEALATDQLVRVRRILSHALARDAAAPRGLVLGLARDAKREVAMPLLEHSPVLIDKDLIEIVEDGAPDWAQEAIAGRAEVSLELSEAIVRNDRPSAVRRLIENRGARLPEATLDRIVARAPEVESWHAPLVERPSLPPNAIRSLARFVAGPLLRVLRRSQTLDRETESALDAAIEARGADSSPVAPAAASAGPPVREPSEAPLERARLLQRTGKLNDETVSIALGAGEAAFVIAALALRAGLAPAVARRIVSSHSGKAVTALAWKAKFPMRFALDLQRRLAGVPTNSIVYARDGVDYPLSPTEMNWHLGLFAD